MTELNGMLHSVLQGQICLLFQVSLHFLLCTPISYDEKDIFWGVLVLEGLVGLHRTVQLQLLQHYWWGIDLDCCDIEWLAFEMNRDHSFVFEISPKYCISDSFVDYENYSISCKSFLPTVVDMMVTLSYILLLSILVH